MGRVIPLMLFSVLCSVLFAETALDINKKTNVVIRKFQQCKNSKGLTLTWNDVRFGHDPRTKETTYSLKVNVSREVSRDFSIVFSLGKCDASGNPDSCEYILRDYNITDVCKYMGWKNQAWSVFTESFDKPLKCPIKPEIYTLKDGPVTSDFLKYLRFATDAVWKAKMVGYDKGRLMSCVEMEILIASSRNKRRH